MWSTIPLKNSYLLKIAELEFFFFKQKLITDSAILNKWKSFSGMVDKWHGPSGDYIISQASETEDSAVLKNCVIESKQKRREKYRE